MVNLFFCLGALVFFTIGFRLVKLGNPYKRGGGDPYTKRRKYRMLGWMMWTAAGVMIFLSLMNQLSNDQLPDLAEAPSTIREDIARIPTVTTYQRIVPNLLSSPALHADATNSPPGPATFPTGSLTLSSIQQHQQSLTPTLLPSFADKAPAPPRTSDFTVNPETEIASDAAPRPAPAPAVAPVDTPESSSPSQSTPPSVSPPDSKSDTPLDPAKLEQLDAEVEDAAAILKKDPSNVVAYLQRGNAYGNERRWDLARSDYQKALAVDPKCTTASFNLSEMEFMQGHYDTARPGFLAIVNNTDYGDLAKYRVFLCDLFGGHEQAAAKELAVFNEVGSEASYYFANVAWSLYHKKPDSQSWWKSATEIFAPQKVNLYAKPLIDLGYNLAGG
jgi:hypothetical protein